jgi:hypothetical protein
MALFWVIECSMIPIYGSENGKFTSQAELFDSGLVEFICPVYRSINIFEELFCIFDLDLLNRSEKVQMIPRKFSFGVNEVCNLVLDLVQLL